MGADKTYELCRQNPIIDVGTIAAGEYIPKWWHRDVSVSVEVLSGTSNCGLDFSLDHVDVEASRVDGSDGSVTLYSPNYMTNGEHKNGFSCTVRDTSCILSAEKLIVIGY